MIAEGVHCAGQSERDFLTRSTAHIYVSQWQFIMQIFLHIFIGYTSKYGLKLMYLCQMSGNRKGPLP